MKIKDYFYSVREEMPGWLKNHKKGDSIDMNEVLKYRTFYYPGCFDDGNPLGLINNARYCHTFIYVDNGVKKNDIIKKLSEYNAFNGYDLVDLVELKETDLIKSWTPHYHPSSEYLNQMNRWIEITESDSFGVLAIYELKRYEFENIPGSDRFCVLYLGADAAATYDALFLSGKYHVPNMIFISANFDGLAGNFYRGTPLEEIARMGNIMPKYLLIASGEPWKGYSKLNVEPGIRYGSPIYLYQYGN